VNVWPAIVNVPERAGPVLAATLYWTVPPPVPPVPDPSVSQEALLPTAHEQPLPAVTVTVPLELPDGAVALFGAIENVQPLPWFTDTV
jgi:hypothetical protein